MSAPDRDHRARGRDPDAKAPPEGGTTKSGHHSHLDGSDGSRPHRVGHDETSCSACRTVVLMATRRNMAELRALRSERRRIIDLREGRVA